MGIGQCLEWTEIRSKMTDTPSSVEHVTVIVTTDTADYVSQATTTNVMTSSSSTGIEFYFQFVVVVIGVVGTAANALILYGFYASKQHKKHVLIVNQNVLHFISSLLLVITYALKLCNFYLTGVGGYWFCMLLLSENPLWCAILASKINLMSVTIERYLKVVYPTWSKNKLRNWMIYSAVGFAWISSAVHMCGLTFATSDVIGGVCYPYIIWPSQMYHLVYGIWYFLSYYVLVLVTFIFGYWRIVIAIRRQARVMASHSAAGSSTGQSISNQIQTNIIKTMILVSAFYAISDIPMNFYYLLVDINLSLRLPDSFYYAAWFISFFYICTNPFIYAIKFDPVKRALLRLIPCKKAPVQPIESAEMDASRKANRPGKVRK